MFRSVCALYLVLAAAVATDFRDCRTLFNRPVGKPPISAEIGGCDKPPCVFVRGTNISGAMNFIADSNLSVLKPEVTVYLFGVPIPFAINETDACGSLTMGACPLKKGQEARYEYTMLLPAYIPLVSPLMRYTFKDQKNRIVLCAEVPLQIISAPQAIVLSEVEAALGEAALAAVGGITESTTPEQEATGTDVTTRASDVTSLHVTEAATTESPSANVV